MFYLKLRPAQGSPQQRRVDAVTKSDILVICGGIGGLTAAIAAHKLGFTAQVSEQTERFED